MQFNIYCQNIENTRSNGKPFELNVYYGFTDSFVHRLPLFYEYLSDFEKSRADRFRFESDYNCYVTVHALLRIELSRILGTKVKALKLGESGNGKPVVPDYDLPISLSRTKNQFAFVIGQRNQCLGVDIEQIKPGIDFLNISRNYFSLKEQQFILSKSNPDDQKRIFFELWTRKEALLKALGLGLNTELNKVQVLEGENTIDIKGVQIKNLSFKIATRAKKESLISIASSTDFVPEFKNLSFILF